MDTAVKRAQIRSVIFSSTSPSTYSIDTVPASMVLMARIITIYSNTRTLFFIPTDLKSGTTVKHCHTFLSSLPRPPLSLCLIDKHMINF